MSAQSLQTPMEIVKRLELKPHPEGGYYRETYRSSDTIPVTALASRYNGARSVSTSIYYMLDTNTFSAMHRVKSDEVYHFYSGDPLELLLLYPDGKTEVVIIGSDIAAGHYPQFVIPRDCWQGSRVRPGGSYSLIGATVAPGFDFADFEIGKRADLVAQYPAQSDLISALTRE
jgi:uncharacterized protein